MNELIRRLEMNNCDVYSAIMRLGSSDVYAKLVVKFIEDTSLGEYLDAFDKKEYDVAFCHIHSLKGLASSFGFTDLYLIAGEITTAIREKNYSFAESLRDELLRRHRIITDILSG